MSIFVLFSVTIFALPLPPPVHSIFPNVCRCPPADFGSLFDLEHDLPDELISSSELGLANGGDLNQLHTSLGSGSSSGPMGLVMAGPGGQDAAAKHKQLSELLRAGAQQQQQPPQQQQGGPGANQAGPGMGLMGNIKMSPGPQGMGPQSQQQQQHMSPQQSSLMQQQQQMAGMVGGINRGMMGTQKGAGQQSQQGVGPTPQQQGMGMGGQVMNGSPRMGYPNQGMGSNSNLLAETLQQQQPGVAGQNALRAQQPGALNKVGGPCRHAQLCVGGSLEFQERGRVQGC